MSGCSSLYSTMFLRETISYVLEGSSDVFMALIDTKQAFVTVWHESLFYQVFKFKIDYKLWLLLCNYYTGFKCSLKISVIQSYRFQTYCTRYSLTAYW